VLAGAEWSARAGKAQEAVPISAVEGDPAGPLRSSSP